MESGTIGALDGVRVGGYGVDLVGRRLCARLQRLPPAAEKRELSRRDDRQMPAATQRTPRNATAMPSNVPPGASACSRKKRAIQNFHMQTSVLLLPDHTAARRWLLHLTTVVLCLSAHASLLRCGTLAVLGGSERLRAKPSANPAGDLKRKHPTRIILDD